MYELFRILETVLNVYSFVLIIYILMSWFPGARESAFGEIFAKLSEPYLEQFRKVIPPIGMLDISPLVAIIVLRLAEGGLWTLYSLF